MKAFEFVIFRHNDDIEINYIVVAETEKEARDKLPTCEPAVLVNEYKNLILATNEITYEDYPDLFKALHQGLNIFPLDGEIKDFLEALNEKGLVIRRGN